MSYRPKIRTTEIEAPETVAQFEDGSEPFRATIRTSITQADLNRVKHSDKTWPEIWPRFAPFVLAWNLDIPAPAEGGPDQFGELETPLMSWLIAETANQIREAAEEQNVMIRNNATRNASEAQLTIKPPTTAA